MGSVFVMDSEDRLATIAFVPYFDKITITLIKVK